MWSEYVRNRTHARRPGRLSDVVSDHYTMHHARQCWRWVGLTNYHTLASTNYLGLTGIFNNKVKQIFCTNCVPCKVQTRMTVASHSVNFHYHPSGLRFDGPVSAACFSEALLMIRRDFSFLTTWNGVYKCLPMEQLLICSNVIPTLNKMTNKDRTG